MINNAFSPWPFFSADEIDAAKKVLLSNNVNYWTGTECVKFEKEFASYCNTSYAVALSNGSVALELALRALNIGPGDEVIVTPRTFVATVSSIVTAAARTTLMDAAGATAISGMPAKAMHGWRLRTLGLSKGGEVEGNIG